MLVVLGPRGTGRLSLEREDLLRPILHIDSKPSSLNDAFNRGLADGRHRKQVDSLIEANPEIAIVNVGEEFKRSKVFVRTPDGTHLGGAFFPAQ